MTVGLIRMTDYHNHFGWNNTFKALFFLKWKHLMIILCVNPLMSFISSLRFFSNDPFRKCVEWLFKTMKLGNHSFAMIDELVLRMKSGKKPSSLSHSQVCFHQPHPFHTTSFFHIIFIIFIINQCSLGFFGHFHQFHNTLLVRNVKTIKGWTRRIKSETI